MENASLRFEGSVWCNLDIALRSVDQHFRRALRPLRLTVIEWYILRSLYENDGQHASELARTVGRAATSFTPNLDKLQQKGLIERRPDPGDRRAVRIYLTADAEKLRKDVQASAKKLDRELQDMFEFEDYQAFMRILFTLQALNPE